MGIESPPKGAAALAALAALTSRRSVPALQLRAPGPSAQEVDQALEAALHAPDHGMLRPWRFIVIRGAARERLSELFARRTLERDPGTPEGKVHKARNQPLAAQVVIAVGARILHEHKIPEHEQLLSTGAAVMNLLNAFHAQGYGAIWLTGRNAYDPQIVAALGFAADERCLGFVYVGSTDAAAREADRREADRPVREADARRAQRAAIVREWAG
jgi:nitroreductase